MTSKAYIADDDSALNTESKCYIEYDSSDPELKFMVPGCISGNKCNGCGNYF